LLISIFTRVDQHTPEVAIPHYIPAQILDAMLGEIKDIPAFASQ
jgi:hypothetical protein